MHSCTWVCESAGYVPRIYSDDLVCRTLTICVLQGAGDKDLKRRIKQKLSNEEEYELSRYKPLLRTVIEVCSFLFCLSVMPCTVAHCDTRACAHTTGPSLRQARPGWIPVRQGLPPGYAIRVQRQTDAYTDNLAAERQAQLAPRGAHEQRGVRNAPAGARVRRGRDDLLGDARGVHALEPAREGRHHRCVRPANQKKKKTLLIC